MDKKKWEQENVLRLVKKSRKGVLRVVFSRFGLMALLLVLELVLLWMMWRWFNNAFGGSNPPSPTKPTSLAKDPSAFLLPGS